MGDHLALSFGIERHLANREPLAELDQPCLADEIDGRGFAQEIDRGAGGDRMSDATDLAQDRNEQRRVADANIAGPEMVPPGRKCLG